MTGFFERGGQHGKVARDFARHLGADFGRVEREGIEPDAAQAVADGFVAQILQLEAEGARVGKWQVAFPGLREIGVNLEAVAHIHDDQERRRGFVSGQRAGVAFGLAVGADHGFIPRAAAAHGACAFLFLRGTDRDGSERQFGLLRLLGGELLGLQNEMTAPIEVNAARRVVGRKGGNMDGKLKGVSRRVRMGRVRHSEQIRERDKVRLGVRPLGGFGFCPVFDKGVRV